MKRLFRFVPVLVLSGLMPILSAQEGGLPFNTGKNSDVLKAPIFPARAWWHRSFSEDAPRVQMIEPTKLADYVVNGKLELPLRSYLELVIANNTEIQIQKLLIETPKNNITRTFSQFDPTLTTSYRSTRVKTPTQDALAGAETLQQLTQPYQVSYQQTLETGTQYNVGFRSNRTSTNNAFAFFNPVFNTNFDIGFAQPLLRNRGGMVNRIPIMIARTRYQASRDNMEDQILRLVQQAENAYWLVVEAREALMVQEKALELADQVLKRAQLELKLGSISPLEIYQPEQTYANQQVFVTQARYRLVQAEDALRRQIGADLDPNFRDLPIELTETVLPPSDDQALPKEDLVGTAIQRRPDLKGVRRNLDVDELQIRLAKNNLLPNLSLQGNYTAFGRGGTFLQRQNIFAGDGTQSTVINRIPGGFGDAFSQTFGFGFPTYGMALVLNLPIRDRRAAADLADATVARKLDAYRVRNQEQQIRLEVLNAITQVENSRASVQQAQVALDFSEKRVEAEQKRYDLGVTTIFFLLDANNALVQARANLVQQSLQYRRNLTNLLRTTGQLLDERGITVQ